MKTGETSLWMLRAFAAINLVAAFPALIWTIAFAATADGACKIYGTPAECLILGVNWAPALLAITSLTSAILRAALTALVMLGVSVATPSYAGH